MKRINKTQIVVVLDLVIVLGFVAVKDFLLGGVKDSDWVILVIVAIHCVVFYVARTKGEPN